MSATAKSILDALYAALAHASRHASDGADPVTLAESQVTNLVNDLAAKATNANRIAGKTPVASVWDTNPTNLANSTDGDWTTSTGTGTKSMTAAGVFGQLVWDMGATYNVQVRGLVGIGHSTGGSVTIFVDFSTDNLNWTKAAQYYGQCLIEWINTTIAYNLGPVFGRGRYVRLRWNCADAGTYTGSGYVTELQAIDLGA
jgi:hypothetical protein